MVETCIAYGRHCRRCATAFRKLSLLTLCCVAVRGFVCNLSKALRMMVEVTLEVKGEVKADVEAEVTNEVKAEVKIDIARAVTVTREASIQIQIRLFITRPDYDQGRILYYPALEGFKDGFIALEANVSIVGGDGITHIEAQLASRSSLFKSYQIVVFLSAHQAALLAGSVCNVVASVARGSLCTIPSQAFSDVPNLLPHWSSSSVQLRFRTIQIGTYGIIRNQFSTCTVCPATVYTLARLRS